MKTRKYVLTVTVADDAPSDDADYSEMESSDTLLDWLTSLDPSESIPWLGSFDDVEPESVT
jgi:hypothetical protein